MRQVDEGIQRQIGELSNEIFRLQLSRPPVLTNAETPDDERALEDEFDALCYQHGVGEKELEEILEKYSKL